MLLLGAFQETQEGQGSPWKARESQGKPKRPGKAKKARESRRPGKAKVKKAQDSPKALKGP